MADAKPSLAERLLAGDKRALARGISLVEDDDPEGWALVREVYPHTGSAAVVGFTGPPGAGKSTLIASLIKLRRRDDREVAVLSIDPSSPFRGGALLGDRIRLTEHFLDPGVFIRSMATRGALGGLAEAALQTALLMDAAGKDDVFLETVGVGQAEVDVIDHADSVVLVLIPGSGDSIQALKAGVMEIPDVIVVNKSDHPLTDTMVREIRGVLSLAPQGDWPVPIIKTEAHRGEGVEQLAEKLGEHREFVESEGLLAERRRRNLMNEVLGIATVRLRRALEASLREDPEVQELLDEVVARRLDPASAASAILARGAVEAGDAARPDQQAEAARWRCASTAAGREGLGGVSATIVRRSRHHSRATMPPTRAARGHARRDGEPADPSRAARQQLHPRPERCVDARGAPTPSASPNAQRDHQPGRAQQRERAEHGAGARRVAQAPGGERGGDRQPGGEVACREPLAGERRRGERRHRDDAGAHQQRQPGGDLGVGALRDHPRHVGAPRAPQQPRREHAQCEHGRPAQQPDVAVDPERRQPRDPLEVVAGGARPGRRRPRRRDREGVKPPYRRSFSVT